MGVIETRKRCPATRQAGHCQAHVLTGDLRSVSPKSPNFSGRNSQIQNLHIKNVLAWETLHFAMLTDSFKKLS